MGHSYSDGEAGEPGSENLHPVLAVRDILKRDVSISGGSGGVHDGEGWGDEIEGKVVCDVMS